MDEEPSAPYAKRIPRFVILLAVCWAGAMGGIPHPTSESLAMTLRLGLGALAVALLIASATWGFIRKQDPASFRLLSLPTGIALAVVAYIDYSAMSGHASRAGVPVDQIQGMVLSGPTGLICLISAVIIGIALFRRRPDGAQQSSDD